MKNIIQILPLILLLFVSCDTDDKQVNFDDFSEKPLYDFIIGKWINEVQIVTHRAIVRVEKTEYVGVFSEDIYTRNEVFEGDTISTDSFTWHLAPRDSLVLFFTPKPITNNLGTYYSSRGFIPLKNKINGSYVKIDSSYTIFFPTDTALVEAFHIWTKIE